MKNITPTTRRSGFARQRKTKSHIYDTVEFCALLVARTREEVARGKLNKTTIRLFTVATDFMIRARQVQLAEMKLRQDASGNKKMLEEFLKEIKSLPEPELKRLVKQSLAKMEDAIDAEDVN